MSLQLRSQLPLHRTTGRVKHRIQHASKAAMCASKITERDLFLLEETCKIADSSAGLTAPHPNAGCILVGHDGLQLSSAYQRASGSVSAEVQAVQALTGSGVTPATAYLNLESGDCDGEDAAVAALLHAKVPRVVVGMRHPLPHARGVAISALRARGVTVDVLGEAEAAAPPQAVAATKLSVWRTNEALMHRAARRKPMSILKYAMTLDGKIATQSGHSAWITSPPARAAVFAARARSDAVIVGGNTVRRDNPRLTTRRDDGHQPARVVLSRTLDLPEEALLWDTRTVPTIVATQRGVRPDFQARLRDKGVEVVEFDPLTPAALADFCYARGFLECFWECGGVLAAPCISSAVIHKVLAFVAPKIIGGAHAPTPVGELGFQKMTQALQVLDCSWSLVGPDLALSGYLPASGGLATLAAELDGQAGDLGAGSAGPPPTAPPASLPPSPPTEPTGTAITFLKAWEPWGALSNSTPHPITLPHHSSAEAAPAAVSKSGNMAPVQATPDSSSLAAQDRQPRVWPSVEHYYQAQKFAGCGAGGAADVVEAIAGAGSPEEAARIGRTAQLSRPELVTPGWGAIETDVMVAALRAKFRAHEGPRRALLATGDRRLVEGSPTDGCGGVGLGGEGGVALGMLLEEVREELRGGSA